MLRTTFLNSRQQKLASAKERLCFMTWRQLVFVVGAGMALAGLGHLLGRAVHLVWPIPMSGSLAAALPRTVILLAILLRINRFGALTIVGITEVSAKIAFGIGGYWPMALIVPLLSNITGDMIWFGLRQLPSRKMGLILSGGAISGIRALFALTLWTVLPLSAMKSGGQLTMMMGCIFVINIVLGISAGWLVGKSIKSKKGNISE